MYLMYVDESGDPGLNNSPTRYFVLTALVIHELDWLCLLDDYLLLRQHFRSSKGLKMREEIHAKDFINKPGNLVNIKRNDRLDILKQVIDWTGKHLEISTFSVVIDKSTYSIGTDVFTMAWKYLIQRYENTLQYQNFYRPKNASLVNKGIIYADNTDGEKLQKLVRAMRRFNPVSNNRNQYHTGYRMLPNSCHIEDVNMRNSHHSHFIQITDVIAYFVRQEFEPNAYIRSKGAKFYKRLAGNWNQHVSKRGDGIVLY